ncbi:MAG: hypothetical protein JST26_04580 [Bacteroidetes bacterium]|nr:hypothetical protein [Bacteroidota bacterium]
MHKPLLKIACISVFMILAMPGLCQKVFMSDNRNSDKFTYGLFYPVAGQFRNPIASTNNSLSYPLPFISLGSEHPRGYGKRNDFPEWGLNYFLNQIRHNPDGTKTNWCAGSIYLLYKYDVFPQNKYIDLYFGGGGLAGTQVLTARKTRTETYFNFNASLIPHIEFRAQPLKRISVGASANFLYDGTKTKWYGFGEKTYPVGYSRLTGTMVKFFIGWCYGN